MKLLNVCLILSLLFSCSVSTLPPVPKPSKVQIHLEAMADQITKEYKAAPNEVAQQEIKDKYTAVLDHYLRDSCSNMLDSMVVFVNRVYQEIGILRTEFSDNTAFYNFHYSYPTEEEMKKDKIYNFAKSLKEGKDTLLTFLYLGGCRVRTDSKGTQFEIEAMPAPILPASK
jgi:hypothetical protein